MSKSKQPILSQAPVTELAARITTIIETARNRIQTVIDHAMVRAYWEIGREIVEDEQKGEKRAEYGKAVIEGLAVALTSRHGKGFDRSNLWNMRAFYLSFQNSTHCVENCLGRIIVSFYELMFLISALFTKSNARPITGPPGNWNGR